RPRRCLKRRSMSATSSRQSMPSILKVDSACSSQTVQVAMSAPPRLRAFLNVLEALSEQLDDVVIVERVENHLAGAPLTDEAGVRQQPELMRHRRVGQVERGRDVADAEFGARERIENPHPRHIPQHLERLSQSLDGVRI